MRIHGIHQKNQVTGFIEGGVFCIKPWLLVPMKRIFIYVHRIFLQNPANLSLNQIRKWASSVNDL